MERVPTPGTSDNSSLEAESRLIEKILAPFNCRLERGQIVNKEGVPVTKRYHSIELFNRGGYLGIVGSLGSMKTWIVPTNEFGGPFGEYVVGQKIFIEMGQLTGSTGSSSYTLASLPRAVVGSIMRLSKSTPTVSKIDKIAGPPEEISYHYAMGALQDAKDRISAVSRIIGRDLFNELVFLLSGKARLNPVNTVEASEIGKFILFMAGRQGGSRGVDFEGIRELYAKELEDAEQRRQAVKNLVKKAEELRKKGGPQNDREVGRILQGSRELGREAWAANGRVDSLESLVDRLDSLTMGERGAVEEFLRTKISTDMLEKIIGNRPEWAPSEKSGGMSSSSAA